MAVKYVRKGYRKPTTEAHRRAMPGIGGLQKTKQRLLVVYFGVGVLASMILVFQLLGIGRSNVGTPVEQGEARIVGKSVVEEDTGEKRYFLDLRVEFVGLDADRTDSGERAPRFLDDRVEVSGDAWKEFSEGETISVSYRIDRVRERLRVLSILSAAQDGGEE
ncbi:MAG: hypothetical protein IID08_06910 [Candidatus Hydrogenedentes bacterium]|nr:hypothetical protein [Candidatus Hydrogenedentota bacterium]